MENNSGLRPLGVAVLVKDYRPEKKYGKIIIPPNVSERQAMIDSRVQVVAVGPKAWEEEGAPRAVVGDVVVVSKFSGYMAGGADGELYRVVNDRDIFLGMDADAFEAKAQRDLEVA